MTSQGQGITAASGEAAVEPGPEAASEGGDNAAQAFPGKPTPNGEYLQHKVRSAFVNIQRCARDLMHVHT